jgi:hypothetical protein
MTMPLWKNVDRIGESIENLWDTAEDCNQITYAISLLLERLYRIKSRNTEVSLEEFLETALDHIKHNCIAISIRRAYRKKNSENE